MSDRLMVKFRLEDGREIVTAAAVGENLLAAARRGGVPIDAPCAGNGTCGKCRVRIASGALAGERSKHISEREYAEGFRLACQSEVTEDVTVEIPVSAFAYQNQIRVADFSSARAQESFAAMKRAATGAKYRGGEIFSDIAVVLEPPTLDDPMADRERLVRAVSGSIGAAEEHILISMPALRKLPLVLRGGGFAVHVLLRKEARWDGDDDYLIFDVTEDTPVQAGLAIDIGTTTVSAALIDLKTKEFLATGSAGNAQIRYGADVIARLIESAKPKGAERLREALAKECIAPLVKTLCETAGIAAEQICRAAAAGNTTMLHLFLGVYGNFLRMEPYVPAFFDLPRIRGSEADIGIHPDAEVLLAPCIGSYVGGDITAGVFAAGIARNETFSLFIDLGTNGELVFGNSDFLMACACSAGPAFEGGEISCGMRATDGAITSCAIDAETMEPSYTVIGEEGQKPAGLCGSGLIDLIGELFRCGVVNAKGKFIREGARVDTDEWGLTRYTVAAPEESLTGRSICINDADIDNFIRAKASIFSAIITMLRSVDMDPDVVTDIYLAGGIGSGINIEQAIGIGMLPNLDPSRFHYIGNTSLSGAYAMLVSDLAAERISEIAGGTTYIELSAFPGYMDEFIAACFLPHTDASLFRR
ncbi:MAG: ASKHA domain-containing protein [Clostridiales Family XIII bacterium]|nr:ASKHA domain-containing protein [Clostridiales Family XIII bacterium]